MPIGRYFYIDLQVTLLHIPNVDIIFLKQCGGWFKTGHSVTPGIVISIIHPFA